MRRPRSYKDQAWSGRAAATVAALSAACFLPAYALLPGKALVHVGQHEPLLRAVFQGVLVGAVSIFACTRTVAALGAGETALFTAAVPPVTALAVGVVTLGMVVGLGRGRGT